MVSALLSRVVILVFGTLYPAYKSYKAVKTKNVKEYVKWMMYWIVFALFTCVETFTDLFVAWLPFYYELKIVFVLWLLSPATKGASILYRKFVHPQLSKREQDIDAQIDKVTDQGYTALVSLGQKGFQYATNVVLTTAIKGQAKIADQIKRSYSMSDVSTEQEKSNKRDEVEEYTEDEDETDNRLIEASYEREIDQEVDMDTDNMQRATRRRKNRTKEDLDDIDEDLNTANPSRRNTHKEASLYGTLPRTRTRSSKTTTAAKQRHSYHE